jgi:hypothetical protein
VSNLPGAPRDKVPDCELRRAVAAPAQGLPPDANTEQKRKTKGKARGHEKPTEYEPHYPFKPRTGIGPGPGHLVSSPSAIRRIWRGEDDGGQYDEPIWRMDGWMGRRMDGRRKLVMDGGRHPVDSPASRRYQQADQKVIQR